MTARKSALRAVLGDQPIAYHPVLARIAGSVPAGVLLGQLLYWDGVMSAAKGDSWDGWFYKSGRSIERETALKRYAQESARSELKVRGLIQTKLRGVPATIHYHINFDTIESALDALDAETEETPEKSSLQTVDKLDCRPSANKLADSEQTSLPTVDQPVRAPSTNQFADSQQTIHENTHAITHEIQPADPAPAARQLWDKVLDELKLQMTKATFTTWFPLATAESYASGQTGPPVLTIGVRNAYAKEWLDKRLRLMIERAVNQAAGIQVNVVFIDRSFEVESVERTLNLQ